MMSGDWGWATGTLNQSKCPPPKKMVAKYLVIWSTRGRRVYNIATLSLGY